MFTPERLKLELLVGWQVKTKIIALYAPLQFFVVDKNNVINCTALSNYQLQISGTKNYDQLGLFYKNISF